MSTIKEILQSIYTIYDDNKSVPDFIKNIRIDTSIPDNDKFNMIYNYNNYIFNKTLIMLNDNILKSYIDDSSKKILSLLHQADKLINKDCNRLDLIKKIVEKIGAEKLSLLQKKISYIYKNNKGYSPKLYLLSKIFQEPPYIDNLVRDIDLYLENKNTSMTLKNNGIDEEKLKIILNDIKILATKHNLEPIKDILTKKNKQIADQIKQSIEEYTIDGSGFKLEDMKKDIKSYGETISNHTAYANLQIIYPILDKIQNNNITNTDIHKLISHIDNFKPVTDQTVSLYKPNTYQETKTLEDAIILNNAINQNIINPINTNSITNATEEGIIAEKYHFLIADFKRRIDNVIKSDKQLSIA